VAGFQLTAVIERLDGGFRARCVELDIERAGASSAAALANLREAVAAFVASARDSDILDLLTREVEVTLFEVDRT
jgi:hypothetical protein